MADPFEVHALTADVIHWGQAVFGRPLDERPWPGNPSDYTLVRGFLVPRQVRIRYRCSLLQPGSEAERVEWAQTGQLAGRLPNLTIRVAAVVEGEADVRDGQPRTTRLCLSEGTHARVTSSLLERTPVAELEFRALAAVSLTSRQSAEYFIATGSTVADYWAETAGAAFGTGPAPVGEPPLPDLVDDDGRPWWRVRVTRRAANELRKEKRQARGPEFLREVLAVYGAAVADGRSGPDSVADHFDKPRGSSTVFRWIQQAKQLGGDHAQDK